MGILACSFSLITSELAWSSQQSPAATSVRKASAGNSAVASSKLDEAREQFGLGVALLQTEPVKYPDAYEYFARAYQLSGSWKVLGNLGLCAYHLERYGEALNFYEEYLREGAGQVDVKEVVSVRQESSDILKNSGVVSLMSVGQALVVVDTRLGSQMPAQKYQLPASGLVSLRLKAGTHHLVATNTEGQSAILELEVVAGEPLAGRFEFQQVSKPKTSKVDELNSLTDDFSVVQNWGIGVTGVGAASLVAAMGMNFVAIGKNRRAQGQCNTLGPDEPVMCEGDAEANFSDQASFVNGANILLAVGGVASTTGVAMMIFGGSDGSSLSQEESQAVLELSPFWQVGGGGLVAKGTF